MEAEYPPHVYMCVVLISDCVIALIAWKRYMYKRFKYVNYLLSHF